MKKLATILGLAAVVAMAAAPAFAANQVRISQVYGGGGSASAGPTYNVDYVELFNSGGTAVNIGGWTIEYGSATGNWGSSTGNIFTFPEGTTMQPCAYVLVQCGSAGSGGAAFPVTPDFIQAAGLSMSATSGKVGLFTAANSNLACGSELAGTLVDKVAYGTATCAEGTAVGALSQTSGAVRLLNGATDTDNNSADFIIESASLVPRNSAPGQWDPGCLSTPAEHPTWGALKSAYR